MSAFATADLLFVRDGVIWLHGSVPRAREKFVERGGIDVQHFDDQCRAIQQSGLPAPLLCFRIEALSEAGILKEAAAIVEKLFRR